MSDKFIYGLKLFFVFLCFLIEGVASSIFGAELPDSLQIHGFATQGFILTSDNNFFGKSKDGSFDFTELGVNTSIRPILDMQISAQVISRRAGEGNDRDPQLDYGFLDYSLISNASRKLGIRLGRVKNPLGFYNDTRDVAFTRPSIFLPQSIYFGRTRNLALSSDGLNIYAEYRKGFANLFYELEVGYPKVDDRETELAFLGQKLQTQGGLDERLSYISRFIIEPTGGRIRIALSGALVNIIFEPKTSAVKTGTIRFTPLIFSVQYNTEFWSLSSEYALRYSRYRDVGPLSFNNTGESYYLQGSYRISEQLEAVLRYDVLFQNQDDRSGTKFSAASTTGALAHTRFAKDSTVGLRWDITSAWMSRIEYHYIDGTAWLPLSDNPVASATERYWDLFSILVSFRF